jgi:cytosine/adenosine deaminase-related metal-dependent hydrolase
VRVSLPEELRMLEYAQRLGRRARNIVAEPGGSTGRALFEGVLRGGAAALARPLGFAVGADADVVTLRDDALGREGDDVLDGWIFACSAVVDCVYARGRRVVEGGEHFARASIRDRFRAMMLEMAAA